MRHFSLFFGLLTLLCAAPFSESHAAEGRCVSGTCWDGYTGCGCDVSCCERRWHQKNGGGGSGSAGSGDANPWMPLMQNLMEGLFRPTPPTSVDPAELERQRQAEADRQLRLQEEQRLRAQRLKEKNDRLDAQARSDLSLLDDPSRPAVDDQALLSGISASNPGVDPKSPAPGAPQSAAKTACFDPKSEEAKTQYRCQTLTCGGTNLGPVCCPNGFPYLNHCDCLCYNTSQDLKCNSYSACQYEYQAPTF